MYKHIVMWKLKDQAEGLSKQDLAIKIKSELEKLEGLVGEIKKIEVGIDLSRSESSYDLVLTSEFENKDSCEKYIRHPKHLEIAGYIGKVQIDRIVVDYEI